MPIWEDSQLGLKENESVEDAVNRELKEHAFEEQALLAKAVQSMRTGGVDTTVSATGFTAGTPVRVAA